MAVSSRMQSRLASIDKLVSEGYKLSRVWNAFPVLISSSGARKNISVTGPAGFSWIAFFFPFAVCAQVKEWSYFYVAGFVYLVGAVIHKALGWDPSSALGIALGFQYGLYYPYLRWLSLQEQRQEMSVGLSIVIGLLLSVVCIIPSIVFEGLFIS